MAKVCLFYGLRSICLYNLIEGRFIWDPGIFRRVLWKASVVHVELRILKGHNITAGGRNLKRLDTREHKQSFWSGDRYNDTLEKLTGWITMLKKLLAMIFSVWSRQYCLQTEIFWKWLTWWKFLLSCIKHFAIIQLNSKVIFRGFDNFIHLTLSDCCDLEKFMFY